MANHTGGNEMRPPNNMTLEECREEERRRAPEFRRLIVARDEAQARLDAYLLRRKELTDRIIELLEAN